MQPIQCTHQGEDKKQVQLGLNMYFSKLMHMTTSAHLKISMDIMHQCVFGSTVLKKTCYSTICHRPCYPSPAHWRTHSGTCEKWHDLKTLASYSSKYDLHMPWRHLLQNTHENNSFCISAGPQFTARANEGNPLKRACYWRSVSESHSRQLNWVKFSTNKLPKVLLNPFTKWTYVELGWFGFESP